VILDVRTPDLLRAGPLALAKQRMHALADLSEGLSGAVAWRAPGRVFSSVEHDHHVDVVDRRDLAAARQRPRREHTLHVGLRAERRAEDVAPIAGFDIGARIDVDLELQGAKCHVDVHLGLLQFT
jgi:hypothetical protein